MIEMRIQTHSSSVISIKLVQERLIVQNLQTPAFFSSVGNIILTPTADASSK